MAWKYIGAGRFIPGVPQEDMTDEEFAEVEKRYDTQYSDDQRGSLRTCGLYEQVKDKKAAAAAESEG